MIKNKKIKLVSEGGEAASLPSRISYVKGKERHIAKNNLMSPDTRDFIQKICYRKTASKDMTQYGFITDSKVNPVNYVINPLRAQLEKIRVKPVALKHRSLMTPSQTNAREVGSHAKLRPASNSKSVTKHPCSSPIKARVVVSPELMCGPAERNPSSSQAHHLSDPKSALSNPWTRSTRACVRKVRIQSDPSTPPSSVTYKQVTGTKVTLVTPREMRQKQEKYNWNSAAAPLQPTPRASASSTHTVSAATSPQTSAKDATAPPPAGPPAAVAQSSNTNASTAPKVPARYPPLVVEVLPDWPTHFRKLKRILGQAPNGSAYGKGVRFMPKSETEYRAVQRYLTNLEKEAGVRWFCYSLPAEQSLKVAIRGLPVNTEPAEIEAELRELGYVPEYVRAIRARSGRPGCLYFAQLQKRYYK